MVINIKYLALIILILFSSLLWPQESKQITRKKSELSDIKDQISSLESELKLKTSKEKENYNVLDNYNKQSYLLHRLINNLKNEEQKKEYEIEKTSTEIKTLQKDIKLLKENYSKYVVAIYKRGKPDELASVLDADSFEQALLRYKYLEKFSDRRRNDLHRLKDKTEKLITAKKNLEKEKEEKLALTNSKQEEEKNLNEKRIERKNVLKAIRHDKAALKSELLAKKSAETRIQNLISKLVEEEKRRREEEVRLAKAKSSGKSSDNLLASKTNETLPKLNNEGSYDVNLSTKSFTSFSSLKGKLNWPVERGKIYRKFGENTNQRLQTVTLNYGIDIKTTSDADVRAVAEGVVSAIDWLPGYGSVVIITHKGDYRTVFSHLSNIFVKEGDIVKPGTTIGRVGESLEGNILHFEIWNSRNKQNPENWLARK
jgi:septal ring factor EnvC (AmiA/AmiB activator)